MSALPHPPPIATTAVAIEAALHEWASAPPHQRLPLLDLRPEAGFMQQRLVGACNIPLVS